MIPNTRQKTQDKKNNTIEDTVDQMAFLKRTIYIGLAATAMAVGAQRCADTYQQRALENRVDQHETHVRTYEDRINTNQDRLEEYRSEAQSIRENGFYIGDPCYNTKTDKHFEVTPCSTTKTE